MAHQARFVLKSFVQSHIFCEFWRVGRSAWLERTQHGNG
jgi:hypothetical protein